jgi:hypothetical protein
MMMCLGVRIKVASLNIFFISHGIWGFWKQGILRSGQMVSECVKSPV